MPVTDDLDRDRNESMVRIAGRGWQDHPLLFIEPR